VLEAELRQQIREAAPEALAQEHHLLWILYWCKQSAIEAGETFEISPFQSVREALLTNSIGETKTRGTGTRFFQVEKSLFWDQLIALFGDEDAIRQTVDQAKADDDPLRNEAIELAKKYLSGWRPKRF
jgi:hypothetical protein